MARKCLILINLKIHFWVNAICKCIYQIQFGLYIQISLDWKCIYKNGQTIYDEINGQQHNKKYIYKIYLLHIFKYI